MPVRILHEKLASSTWGNIILFYLQLFKTFLCTGSSVEAERQGPWPLVIVHIPIHPLFQSRRNGVGCDNYDVYPQYYCLESLVGHPDCETELCHFGTFLSIFFSGFHIWKYARIHYTNLYMCVRNLKFNPDIVCWFYLHLNLTANEPTE